MSRITDIISKFKPAQQAVQSRLTDVLGKMRSGIAEVKERVEPAITPPEDGFLKSPLVTRLTKSLQGTRAGKTGAFAGSLTPENVPAFSNDPATVAKSMQGLQPTNPQPMSREAIQSLANAAGKGDTDTLAKAWQNLGQNNPQQGSASAGTLVGGAAVLSLLLSSKVIRSEIEKNPDILQQLAGAIKSMGDPKLIPGKIKEGVKEVADQANLGNVARNFQSGLDGIGEAAVDVGTKFANTPTGQKTIEALDSKPARAAFRVLNAPEAAISGAVREAREANEEGRIGNPIVGMYKGLREDYDLIQEAQDLFPDNPRTALLIGIGASIVTPTPGELKYLGKGGKELKALKGVGKAADGFKGFDDLTTKTLNELVGKKNISSQFILDTVKRPEIKQAERDIATRVLADMGNPKKLNAEEFANRMKQELLPLDTKLNSKGGEGRYEHVALPEAERGDVAEYYENIYQSPIRTKAGDVHFGASWGEGENGEVANYFAHTRLEDMADGKTRRVVELQSDLFQKGRLDNEGYAPRPGQTQQQMLEEINSSGISSIKDSPIGKRTAEVAKLEPYQNIWHERIIREEAEKAVADGKKTLQFPDGQTAMKIEGLGSGFDQGMWRIIEEAPADAQFKFNALDDVQMGATNLKPGMLVNNRNDESTAWVVTDVLSDGKFKAIPKEKLKLENPARLRGQEGIQTEYPLDSKAIESFKEEFDVSGKVDENNPIYKFYEKDVQKFLNKNYKAKHVTDEHGYGWIEVDLTDKPKAPVQVFGAAVAPTAGFEQDEEGNTTFDAKKAALATVGVAAGGKALKTLTGKNTMTMRSLSKAKNAGQHRKSGGVARAVSEIKAGKSRPIRVRKLPEGGLFIEDGLHRLAAYRKLGIKRIPIEDVTKSYQ